MKPRPYFVKECTLRSTIKPCFLSKVRLFLLFKFVLYFLGTPNTSHEMTGNVCIVPCQDVCCAVEESTRVVSSSTVDALKTWKSIIKRAPGAVASMAEVARTYLSHSEVGVGSD